MNATITQKQASILKRKAIPFDPNMGRNEARKLVKLALQSASPKTRQHLDSYGIEYDPFISQTDAHALIESHTRQTRALYEELNDQPDLLLDLASATTTWARVTSHHAKGTCPLCGAKNFYINRLENIGGCSGCAWQNGGNGAGPVGFYAALNGLEWHDATRQLAGSPRHATTTRTHHAHPARATSRPSNDPKWRDKWTRILSYGLGRLSIPQNATRLYLESRGIEYSAMQAFGVSASSHGYGQHRHIECALFPYYDDSGQLRAVNRRLATNGTRDKTRMALGSQKREAFFGVTGFSGLTWIIEGEINAMSVWQALQSMGRSDTVLSVSSETDIKARSVEFADRWGANAVIWCDKQEIADVARGYGLAAWATRQDANDLLLNGKLVDCIEWMLRKK